MVFISIDRLYFKRICYSKPSEFTNALTTLKPSTPRIFVSCFSLSPIPTDIEICVPYHLPVHAIAVVRHRDDLLLIGWIPRCI